MCSTSPLFFLSFDTPANEPVMLTVVEVATILLLPAARQRSNSFQLGGGEKTKKVKGTSGPNIAPCNEELVRGKIELLIWKRVSG